MHCRLAGRHGSADSGCADNCYFDASAVQHSTFCFLLPRTTTTSWRCIVDAAVDMTHCTVLYCTGVPALLCGRRVIDAVAEMYNTCEPQLLRESCQAHDTCLMGHVLR
jgi:hypothetical protein